MSIINSFRKIPRNNRSYSIHNSISSYSSIVSEETKKNSIIQKQNINQLADENNYAQEINLSRKLEFDRGMPLSFGFTDNKIFTIPFSFKGYISFISKKISSTPFNICIIIVCLYYVISFLIDMDNFGDLNSFFAISFHLLILFLNILSKTFEYISIYINDTKVNNQIAHIYDNNKKKFIDSKWKEIKVGHIIKIYKNDVVPADIILLESMDHKDQC